MNDLELWEGLDFSKYQLGDKIIISRKDVLKRGILNGKVLSMKLEQMAFRLKLYLAMEFNDETDEYEIEFMEDQPISCRVPRPDAKTSRARRK